MRTVFMASFLLLLTGCGKPALKQETTTKGEEGWRAGLTEEQAAEVMEHDRVGRELYRNLIDALPTATQADAELAEIRLHGIRHKYEKQVATGELQKAAPWRRALLEGRTVGGLAQEQQEAPIMSGD